MSDSCYLQGWQDGTRWQAEHPDAQGREMIHACVAASDAKDLHDEARFAYQSGFLEALQAATCKDI